MSEDRDRGRFDAIDDADRLRRPAVVQRLTFDELALPGPAFRDTRHLVPIESVRAGDEQVFAARGQRGSGEPVIDLDPLADHPSVRSVVASTTVRARRPLPQVDELLLFGQTVVPDSETLRNLPGLEQLWAGWAPGGPFDVAALPDGLRALGVCRHNLPAGSEAAPRFAELTRFAGLRHLALNHCWPGDSVAPLAGLPALVRFRADAPSGWSALRACPALEDVSAIGPRMANLRALRTWTRLRTLTLTGASVRALAGMEAFAALERLRLVMLTVTDLAPLTGLPRLADVELVGLQRVPDLAPLGTLPSLRRLVVARAGGEYRDIVHVDSLRPLAAAQALEEVVLTGTVVDDGDLAPLAELPALRRVVAFGEVSDAVAALRRARPDIDVTWHGAGAPPGERVGAVLLRPPLDGMPRWWIREDLTALFGVSTNAAAEARLRAALASEDRALLARLSFDTEADAVHVDGEREDDLRAVARAIGRLVRPGADETR